MLAEPSTCALSIRLLRACPTTRQRRIMIVVVLLAGIVAFNGFSETWFASVLLATMFFGTVLYRLTTGEQPQSRVIALFLLSAVVVATACVLNEDKPAIAWSIRATYAVFGIGLSQRHRRYPRPIVHSASSAIRSTSYTRSGTRSSATLWTKRSPSRCRC